ncbi:MAG: hypothetical protein O3A87_10135 [Verrucomicrobia bacterium]|nr:hypothetical protein [Verrucomicrobiota bacterium]
MSGKVFGVAFVGSGLRGILESDPGEFFRGDERLVIPAVLDGLSGGTHHERGRGLIHPLECGMRNAECEVGNVEWGMRSGVGNAEWSGEGW